MKVHKILKVNERKHVILFLSIYIFFYILTFEYYILCCTRGAGYSVLLTFFFIFCLFVFEIQKQPMRDVAQK